MPATPRPLRRLRRLLALLAILTALLIAAACRMATPGRAVAVTCTVACLVAWTLLLDREGRVANRLEYRGRRYPA